MLDATERKTLAWCMFIAGILCVIPGEAPKGPKPMDYAIQLSRRLLDHHASHIAWGLTILLVVYHVKRSRAEEAQAAQG